MGWAAHRGGSTALALACALLSGCLGTGVVQCDDGRVCAVGTECRAEFCATPSQVRECEGRVDGDPCGAVEDLRFCKAGACVGGCGNGVLEPELGETCDEGDRAPGDDCGPTCLAEYCGNSVVDRVIGEVCDDGNLLDRDGCSSVCLVETLSWSQWQGAWLPRAQHSAAYDTARDVLVVFGGDEGNGFSSDLWERDSQGNWQQPDIAVPPPRRAAAMAYDSDRHVVVLFGGRGPDGHLDDTWEYDGISWQLKEPTTSPPPRRMSAMAYDPMRQRMVLFSGTSGSFTVEDTYEDTWEYDGTNWILQDSLVGPPLGRAQHRMVWDEARDAVVLFGGRRGNSVLSDTWLYQDGQYSVIDPMDSSLRRWEPMMSYWSVSQSVIVFGGHLPDSGEPGNDTHENTSDGWQQLALGTSPDAVEMGTLTECPSCGALVLIGGRNLAAGGLTDQVWQLEMIGDAPKWKRQTRPGNIPVRSRARLLHDSKRGRMVLPGGYGVASATGTVYLFDGSAWRLSSAALPVARAFYAATYDSTRDVVVLFGGLANGHHNETFEWSGEEEDAFVEVQNASPPPPRRSGSLVHDPTTGLNVLFGGVSDTDQDLAETWVYDGATWTDATPSGGPPAQANPAMAFHPERGHILLVDVDGVTWEWDQDQWVMLEVIGTPGPRDGSVMVYNPNRKAMLLYGGSSPGGEQTLSDTWELVATDEALVWQEASVAGSGPVEDSVPMLASYPEEESLVFVGNGETWFFRYD